MDIQEFLTPGWIGLLITIVGFISYYLGKIVLDFYPSKEDKALNHIVGILLFLIYILIPASLIYYFRDYLILNLNWWLFILFWCIYGFLDYYIKIKYSVFLVSRGQANKLFFEKFEKMISLFGMNLNKMNKSKKIFTELPSQITVMILGYILIFLVLNMILFFDYIFIQILIFIIVLHTFNNILVLHNARSIVYPRVTLEDNSGVKHEGNIIKQDADYVLLNTGKEMLTFPRENVKLINSEIKINLEKVEEKIGKVAKKTKPLLEKYFPKTQDNSVKQNSKKEEGQ